MTMLAAELRTAMRLFRDYKAGDVAATREVRDLFSPADPCFLCDQPAGDDRDLLCTEDPAQPNSAAILAPLCADCMAQPTQQRLHQLRLMMAATFRGVRRHDVRLASAAALRRLG